LATYVLLASLKGELVPGPGHVSLWEGIQFQLFERQSTGSILEPGSVSSHTVQGWLHLDPWLLGVGLVLAPAAIATPKLRAVGFVLLTMSAAVLRDGYLPLMYVVAAIPFLALVVAGLVDGASQAVRLRSDRRLVPRSWSRVRRLVVRRSATAVLATLLALGIGIVAIDWAAGLRAQLEADSEAPFRAARSWISSNVTRETPLLVDNVMWMDLVLSKYERDSVISYWKLDLDPAIAERFPEGWRDFRYVVSTPDIRSSLDQLPNVDLALRNSRPVASFGQGAHRVEIRRIVRGVAGGGPPRTGG